LFFVSGLLWRLLVVFMLFPLPVLSPLSLRAPVPEVPFSFRAMTSPKKRLRPLGAGNIAFSSRRHISFLRFLYSTCTPWDCDGVVFASPAIFAVSPSFFSLLCRSFRAPPYQWREHVVHFLFFPPGFHFTCPPSDPLDFIRKFPPSFPRRSKIPLPSIISIRFSPLLFS